MAVYRYTLNKYLRSWSTWIIIGVSFLFTFILGGWLPFEFFNPTANSAERHYMELSIGLVAGVTTFLSIFTSIFAGFKSAQMFKDEVEDGTFLLLLSKPIPRGKIIFAKWMSLQTVMLVYTFITAFAFMIAMLSFDTGDKVSQINALGVATLSQNAPWTSMIMWAILSIFGLIFSSIALLLSTRLSTGTTIGIAIAIGVFIPMTGIISYFTKKVEVEKVANNELENTYTAMKSLDEIYNENSDALSDMLNKSIEDISTALSNQGVNTSIIVNPNITTDVIWNGINNSFMEFYNNAKSNEGLSNVGVATGQKDAYSTAWVGDLYYQVGQISSLASNISIPDSLKNNASIMPVRMINKGKVTQHVTDLINTNTDWLAKSEFNSIQDFKLSLRDQMHYLFLIANNITVNAFNEDVKAFLLTDSKGYTDFKFNIDKEMFELIKDNLFDSTNPTTTWHTKSNDGKALSFEDMQELISRLLIVELKYIEDHLQSPLTAQDYIQVKNGDVVEWQLNPSSQEIYIPTYANLTDHMYYNWMAHHNTLATKDETLSYLIPYVGKLISNEYANYFNGRVNTKSAIANDKVVIYYKQMLYYSKIIDSPLDGMLYYTGNLNNIADKYKIDIFKQPSFNIDERDALPPAAPGAQADLNNKFDYAFNPLNLYGNELNTYNALVAFDDAGMLVRFEEKDYVNPWYLLWFYLGLAVLLVPISYFSIRRQDYR